MRASPLNKKKRSLLIRIATLLLAGSQQNAPPQFIPKTRVDNTIQTCASGVFHKGQGNMCFYYSVHKAMPSELRSNFDPTLIKDVICGSYRHSQPQTQNPCDFGEMADANIIQEAARRFSLKIIALKAMGSRYELNYYDNSRADDYQGRLLSIARIRGALQQGESMDILRNTENLIIVKEENAHFEPFII